MLPLRRRSKTLLPQPLCRLLPSSTFVEAKIKWVRDRALDHAVEKEKHLRPLHNLKNLLHKNPPLSLPSISSLSAQLLLPFRAIRFIRKYPSAFIEQSTLPHPTILPTPNLSRLHEEERLVFSSSKAETAVRLLRLLMLSPYKRLPLDLITHLRWDLGLPDDYPQSLLPDFPDYFQITAGASSPLDLELVCWDKDLAVSEMETRGIKSGGYRKGDPLAFPMKFPRGFQMEKKVKKWVEEFQRAPYLSPYEDSGRCVDQGSMAAEKWTVAMLHEVLSLMIGKKTGKEELIVLGDCLGLRAGFKKAWVHYPGIFYQSNKNREHTILLREGYKRDMLVEKHPLMGMRFQYIHLMKESSAMDAASGPAQRDGNLAEEFVAREDDDDDDDKDDEDDDDCDYDDDDDDDGEESMCNSS